MANEATDADEAVKDKANEANKVKANEANKPTSGQNKAKANEADVATMPAKANEADKPTSGQNEAEANEADVAIMPAKADEPDAKANKADKVILIGKAIIANDTDEADKAIKAANDADAKANKGYESKSFRGIQVEAEEAKGQVAAEGHD